MNVKNSLQSLFILIAVSAIQLIAEPLLVNGFLQNSLNDLSVDSRRVVVASDNGINWCNDIVANPNSWRGISGITPITSVDPIYRDGIVLSSEKMVVQLQPEEQEFRWLYFDFNTEAFGEGQFQPAGLSSASVLYGRNGVFYNDAFYLAGYDAGVIQVQDGSVTGIIIPTVDSVLPPSYIFPVDGFPEDQKVVALELVDSMLYVLTQTTLNSFDLVSSTWGDEVVIPTLETRNWETLKLIPSGLALIASFEEVSGTIDTVVYLLKNDSLETLPETDDQSVTDLDQSENGSFYILDRSEGINVVDSLGVAVSVADNFMNRLESSDGFGGTYSITDLEYSSIESDSIMVIATNVGLLYSLDEFEDERNSTSFQYIRKDIEIQTGLQEVYAVPFIVNNQSENLVTYFKYSLREAASVSIDIFDYNMNFVCRVVDSQNRSAGTQSGSGLSSDRNYDFWDGSFDNNGGNTVSPGMYYFRISTDKGEQGFGKIIIAKN